MLGRTHVVVAWVTWTAAWWRPVEVGAVALAAPAIASGGALDVPITLAAVALGALLPDLDHPRAWLARWSPGRSGGLMGWVRPFLIPSLALHEEFGHRGALHSLVAALAVSLGAEYVAGQAGFANVGAALGWGYGSHLLADMATRRGVPLFLPFARRRVGLPAPLGVRTGGLGETLYLALLGALAALYATAGAAWPAR